MFGSKDQEGVKQLDFSPLINVAKVEEVFLGVCGFQCERLLLLSTVSCLRKYVTFFIKSRKAGFDTDFKILPLHVVEISVTAVSFRLAFETVSINFTFAVLIFPFSLSSIPHMYDFYTIQNI